MGIHVISGYIPVDVEVQVFKEGHAAAEKEWERCDQGLPGRFRIECPEPARMGEHEFERKRVAIVSADIDWGGGGTAETEFRPGGMAFQVDLPPERGSRDYNVAPMAAH